MSCSAKPQYWQIAAGDSRRDYVTLCLDWGLVAIGPGAPGPWNGSDEPLYEGYSSRGLTKVRKLHGEVGLEDRVVLKLGKSAVYGLGVVAGPYGWNSHLGDIDGWDLQHFRRVRWFWRSGAGVPARVFDNKPLKIGTVQSLAPGPVWDWYDSEWEKAGKPNGDGAQLPLLPSGDPKPIGIDEIGRALFAQGLDGSRISETIARIEEIKRLADWYWDEGVEPSESETVAHLVVPLLKVLGWTPQRLSVEWNQIDLALFDSLPRDGERLGAVVEVKRMDETCLGAKDQAEWYATVDGREACRLLIVTDGMRYGVFKRRGDGGFSDYPDAYLNLRHLVRDYPLLRRPTDKPERENGAARAMALLSADLRAQ